MRLLKWWCFCCCVCFSAMSEAEVSKQQGLQFSGNIVGSYNYLLRSNQFVSGVNNRLYDLNPNGFTLQQIYTTLSLLPDQGFGGLFNLIVGRDASHIAPNGMNADQFDSQDLQLAIPQAFAQYTKKNLTVRGGELLSLAGLEQIDYSLNTNFSRSIVDGYAQNGSHVGLRVIDEVNQKLSLIAGVANGWSTVKQSGRQNNIEFGFIYTPMPELSINLDGITGPSYLNDSLDSGPTGNRYLIDFFATYQINASFSVATNYDFGAQSKALLPSGNIARAEWQGLAAYMNYVWNTRWSGSVRGEVFADSNGYRTGIRQNWREATLTVSYVPYKNVLLQAETRHDFSNVPSFQDKNGINTSNNQQSYALEAMYEF